MWEREDVGEGRNLKKQQRKFPIWCLFFTIWQCESMSLAYHLPLIIPCLVINPTTPFPSSHQFMCLLCSSIPSATAQHRRVGALSLPSPFCLCEEGGMLLLWQAPFLGLETQTHCHSWGIPQTKIIFFTMGFDWACATVFTSKSRFWLHKRSSV